MCVHVYVCVYIHHLKELWVIDTSSFFILKFKKGVRENFNEQPAVMKLVRH